MKTVELSVRDWVEIYYVLENRGRHLEEMNLGKEAKDLERIRTLIKEQIM